MNTALKLYDKTQLQKVEIKKNASCTSEIQNILELMGWNDLPSVLITVISEELSQYAHQIKHGYCIADDEVLAKRNRISFWVHAYKDGICSLSEVLARVQD